MSPSPSRRPHPHAALTTAVPAATNITSITSTITLQELSVMAPGDATLRELRWQVG